MTAALVSAATPFLPVSALDSAMSVRFDRFKDMVSSTQPHQSQSTKINLGSSENGLTGANFHVSEARKWQTAAFFARLPIDLSMLARFDRFKDWFRVGGLHWCKQTKIEPAFSQNGLERSESDVRKSQNRALWGRNGPGKARSDRLQSLFRTALEQQSFFLLKEKRLL